MTTPIVKPPLSLEDAATYPLPGTAGPSAISFTPDGSALVYLRSGEGNLVRQLYTLDLTKSDASETLLVAPPGGGATEENLSLEEKLRRERQRQRELGVTSYAWAPDGDTLLVPLTGKIYVKTAKDSGLRLLVDPGPGAPPALDPQLSPDGSQVAYVHDDELFVVPVAGGAPKQLTTGARGTGKTHGLAEYIAQEEMHRSHGFWWSKDGKHLAFTEVDETHIPVYRIVHQGKDATGDDAQEDHRYPFAGAANAKVRLAVVPAAGGKPVWIDLGELEYLARVAALPDGTFAAQTQDRAQKRLRLLRADPKTGKTAQLLEETQEPWLNLHDDLRGLKPGADGKSGFVWSSERTGFRHLELRAADGALVRQLTEGTWPTHRLVAADEDRAPPYFPGCRAAPPETPPSPVPLAGGPIVQLTREPGTHGVVFDRKHRRFVDIHSSTAHPATITVRDLDGGAVVRAVPVAPDPRVAALDLKPPELVPLKNRHGDTLWAAIYRPDPDTLRADGGAPALAGPPYPTLVDIYGGPHAQRVVDSWGTTVDMRAQALRTRGYLVLRVDNRGSARRGLAFEGVIHRDLGHLELEDQVDAIQQLAAQGLVDPQRVGIFGWSYGGYLAAMAVVRHPDVFRLGVAGAPVTHWDGYDTHYTERYMGTPQDNPEGYAQSSVMAHAGELRGALLLVHGLIDENVHFRHTARLINALIRARKPYELLLFPDERHMPRRLEDRVHMEEQIFAFIQKHLE